MHGRYHNGSTDRRLAASTPSLGVLFALVASVVAFLAGILLTSQAAQAQGLLDGAQGAVQQTGAPSAPAQEQQAAPVQGAAPVQQPEPATVGSTQQTTAPISAPASEPAQDQAPAPIQRQAALGQEQTIEPVAGAAGQTTDTAPGTAQETAEPVLDPVGQTTGAAIDTIAQTAEPGTAPVEQTAEPVVGTVQQSAEPVVDTVNETTEAGDPVVQPVVDTVEETAEPVLKPVQETVEPVVEPVQQTVEPVVDTVEDTAKPVLDTVDPIVQPVKDTVDPVVDPVKETIDPVIKPVQDTVDPVIEAGKETLNPVIDPVKDPLAPAASPGVPGAKPVQETIDPVDPGGPGVKPNERPDLVVATTHQPDELLNQRPEPTGAAIEALEGSAQQAAEPVLGSTLDLVLQTESSPGDAPVLEEGAIQVGKGPSARGVMVSAQAPVGTVAMRSEGPLPPSFSMGVSIREHSWILDYFATTTARGAQDVLPRPSPFSGVIPVGAAGSSSSGLGASSGGLGFDALVAMLLILSALYSRLLLFLRDFLRPNSALVLAIERPG